ncbi:MAG: hypothetical protein IPO81_19660 [Kouleothrix sp.]|nr:hypothetical protein [Kouleothrix sp.]
MSENQLVRLEQPPHKRQLCGAILLALALAGCTGPAAPAPTSPPATAAPSAPPATQTTAATSPPATAAPTAPPATPTTAPTAAPTPQPESAYDNLSDPISLLASLYSAINLKDYQRAYGYWQTPPSPTLDEFARGYADTASVELIVGPPPRYEGAAGSQYASIPTVLVSSQVDGSRQLFAGCYVARRANPAIEGAPKDGAWHLNQATIAAAPAGSDLGALLDKACESQGADPRGYDNPSTPIDLLASFYDAVNRKQYLRAYAYWVTPPAPSADEFARGYADTTAVLLAVRPPGRLGAAAGSQYTSIPTLLVATHADGSRHTFAGCYVAQRPNQGDDAPWRLYDATIAEAPAGADQAGLLQQACPPS